MTLCSGLTSGGLVVFYQANLPLIDSLKVYANKMGGSQLIWLQAAYQNSKDDHTSFSGTKSKVALVGNSYSGTANALKATFVSGPPAYFTSFDLKDLQGNTPSPSITLHETLQSADAALFTDPWTWWLY